MRERYAGAIGIEWRVADVRALTEFEDGSFDVAIDKGTLDAMISGSVWDPPIEVRRNTGLYVDEVIFSRNRAESVVVDAVVE